MIESWWDERFSMRLYLIEALNFFIAAPIFEMTPKETVFIVFSIFFSIESSSLMLTSIYYTTK
jgi:hypothetical protein